MIKPKLLAAGGLLGLALIAGRLTGFLRELVLASTFGISAETDVLIVLLTIPDLLVNLLLSGGLSIALIPAMRQVINAEKSALVSQTSLLILLLFGLFGFIFLITPNWFFLLIAPGINLESLQLTPLILIAVSLAIPLTALSGVTAAALNANGHFFIAGCGTLIFNASIIVAMIVAAVINYSAIAVVSIGIAVGALLRLTSQALLLINLGIWSNPLRRSSWVITPNLVKTFITGLSAVSLLVVVPVLIRACASYLGEGQLTTFNFAIKLTELPIGIAITTLATVSYPHLCQAFADKNEHDFQKILSNILYKSIIISIAISLCGWQFSEVAVNLLFGFAQMTQNQRSEISALTQIGMLSIPFVAITSLLSATHNARNNSKIVLYCNIVSLFFLLLFLSLSLIVKNAEWLMVSFPLFYFILSLFLCRGINFNVIFKNIQKKIKVLVIMITVFIPFLMIDFFLQKSTFSFPQAESLVRVLCGATACIVMIFIAFALFKNIDNEYV